METKTSDLIVNHSSGSDRLSEVEWQPYEGHKNKSSQVYVDSDRRYLKKTKTGRGERKRDHEFFNLVVWNQLFADYKEAHDTDLAVPTPYLAQGENIVMEYVGDGEHSDLGHLLASGALLDEDELAKFVRQLGKLAKLMDNEGLRHNDFDLRHVLLEDEGREAVNLIDLEHSLAGVYGLGGEVEELAAKVGETRGNRDISKEFRQGYDAIPEESLIDDAIEEVEQEFEDVRHFI